MSARKFSASASIARLLYRRAADASIRERQRSTPTLTNITTKIHTELWISGGWKKMRRTDSWMITSAVPMSSTACRIAERFSTRPCP